MSLSEFTNSLSLQKILQAKINNSPQQRITFAEYMDLVLYNQEYGYYSSGIEQIGSQGDFFTSSSLGKDFGELFAIQLAEIWHKLGCPNPFYLVEMGAGKGELAQDILNSWLDNQPLLKALKYIIIEQSSALIAKQQKLLQSFSSCDLSWKNWSDLDPNSIEGCFFSNELVDAFPVHLVTKKENLLQEIYLNIDRGKLTETVDSISTDQLLTYLNHSGIDLLNKNYPEGYRTEVNLNTLNWLKSISHKLKRGYVLTIDYGYTAKKYYRPARNQGTLQCYYQHRRHNNPYVNLGYQDITAHVNFTALQNQGNLLNLETIGFTQQGLFLMALGLGDRLNELSSGKYNVLEIFKRRDALHQLIDPAGLGGFGVLVQGKNITEAEKSLQGLTIPDAAE
jgi:SAM-dependent MidA family methyltransferase